MSVNVHPLILISYGGYFKNLLTGGFKESKAKEINVTETIPSDVLKPLIQLLYTGSCDLGDNITFFINLLSVLDMLLLHEILLELVEFISQNLSVKTDDLAILYCYLLQQLPSEISTKCVKRFSTTVLAHYMGYILKLHLDISKRLPTDEQETTVLSILDVKFMYLRQERAFLNLSFKQLQLICSRDSVWIPNENYMAIIMEEWIDHDK